MPMLLLLLLSMPPMLLWILALLQWAAAELPMIQSAAVCCRVRCGFCIPRNGARPPNYSPSPHAQLSPSPRSVGKGSKALLSGGPKSAGPNSVAFSTWWGITS